MNARAMDYATSEAKRASATMAAQALTALEECVRKAVVNMGHVTNAQGSVSVMMAGHTRSHLIQRRLAQNIAATTNCAMENVLGKAPIVAMMVAHAHLGRNAAEISAVISVSQERNTAHKMRPIVAIQHVV